MFVEVRAYCLFEFSNASEYAATNASLGDLSEEAFDLIEPGRAGRREMDDESRMPLKPTLDAGRLVSAVVVQDQVQFDSFFFGIGFVDASKELEKLLMAMLAITLSPRTLPVAIFRAANKEVVPLRT